MNQEVLFGVLKKDLSFLFSSSTPSFFFFFFFLLLSDYCYVGVKQYFFLFLLEVRKKYFWERSSYSLFRNVISEAVFDFLREIGVWCKIWSVMK